MRTLPKLPVLLVVLALAAAACSSSEATESTTTTDATSTSADATTTTTDATTSSSEATTTTTLLPEIPGTINGLPADSDDLINRRVVGVKIDNHAQARPQSGIQIADAVYEILVEGGITRFIALFHQTDSDYVGPNRSGRPTDSKVMRPLNGVFQISGAQPWVQDIFAKDGVHVSYDTGATTWRMPHNAAPHNLYTSTLKIREYADGRGWPDEAPPQLFVYGYEPTPVVDDATKISFDWSDHTPVNWEWDGEQYLRFNGTTPHEWIDEDGQRGQISADQLVVIKGRKSIMSSPTGSGSSVPTTETIGSGEALVFHSGGVLDATWERESITDVIRLVDADGNDIILSPGRIWVNIFPTSSTVTWE